MIRGLDLLQDQDMRSIRDMTSDMFTAEVQAEATTTPRHNELNAPLTYTHHLPTQ